MDMGAAADLDASFARVDTFDRGHLAPEAPVEPGALPPVAPAVGPATSDLIVRKKVAGRKWCIWPLKIGFMGFVG